MPTTRTRQRTPAPVSDSLQRLGERLRKARIEAGLSQAKLAEPHFTRAYVSAIEKGKVRPAMSSLEFLAGKLGKSPSYFLEDELLERKRAQREAAVARAAQLVAGGAPGSAIAELTAIDLDGLGAAERAQVRRAIGRAHLEQGEATKAASALTDALRAYEATGNTELAARVKAELGRALIALMNYEEAEVHLADALRASALGVLKDPLFRVHALYNLGRSFYQRGQYRAAMEQYERALAEGADVADQRWLASVHAAMGMSLREVGDYEGAISNLRKSETLFDAIHNASRVAEIRFQLARTLWQVGSRSKALKAASEAHDAANTAQDVVLAMRIDGFIGMCEAETGSLAGAIDRLRSLVERADAHGEIRSRFSARFALAKVLSEPDPLEAERVLREVEVLLSGNPPSDDLADVYEQLSKVLTQQGRTKEALEYSQRAFKTARRAQKGGV